MSRFKLPLALLPTAALAACAAPSSTPPPPVAAPVATGPGLTLPTRPAIKPGLRQAEVHREPGLESVIGASPAQLAARFGPPRLDVYEGDARKLQFAGEPCVLDVYLYPSARGDEPRATYAEARDAANGSDTDRAACVLALRKSPPTARQPGVP